MSTNYDGAKNGHVNEVSLISVDPSITFATVLGGVGRTEYPCDIPVKGKVDVVPVVSAPYPGETKTFEPK